MIIVGSDNANAFCVNTLIFEEMNFSRGIY